MPGLMKKINFHSTFELNQNSLKNYYMNVSFLLVIPITCCGSTWAMHLSLEIKNKIKKIPDVASKGKK